MSVFLSAYPYVVLAVGTGAAVGVLTAGFTVAWVFIAQPADCDDVRERSIMAAVAIALACGACILYLAFTKWILT